MKTVHRYDRGELRNAVRTDEGYYLVEGYVSRPGVLEYRQDDGSIRRELVLPEELHRADSLSTLARKPVTLEHPPEFVGPENVDKYGVGDTDGEVEVEAMNGFVKVKMAVRRKDGIEAIDRGIKELSPGYTVDLDETAGEHPQYGRYDAIQRNRRYNHTAITVAGRAGAQVALRADSAVQITPFTDHPPKRTYTMDDIKKTVQDELQRRDADDKMKKLESENAELKKKIDELSGKLDAYASKEDEKEDEDDKGEPKKNKKADSFDRMVWFKERQDALAVATRLGVKVEDSADVADIRRAVVKTKLGDRYRADGSEDYVAAAYDMIVLQAGDDQRRDAYSHIGQVLSAPPVAPRQDSLSPEDAFLANLNKRFTRN
jgi:uncharacterized protein